MATSNATPTNVPVDLTQSTASAGTAAYSNNLPYLLRSIYQTLAAFINNLGFKMAQYGTVTIPNGDNDGTATFAAPFADTSYALALTAVGGNTISTITKTTASFTVTLAASVGADTSFDYIAMR